MRVRAANPSFEGIPVDLLFGSSAVRSADGNLDGIKMMALITHASVTEVKWIQQRLKELTHDLALPRDEAVAMVQQEMKDTPWKK